MSAQAAVFIALSASYIVITGNLLWIRKNKNKRTEKSFNVVALWSCVTLVSLYFTHMFDTAILSKLFLLANISVPAPSTESHILATFVLSLYIFIVYKWSISWTGLITKQRYEAINSGLSPSFVLDGIRESIRIAQALPKHQPHTPGEQGLSYHTLPNPILSLSFQHQVRDLILGRWPEYVINDDAWVEEAQCWYGEDRSLDQPIMVICALNAAALKPNRIRAQADHLFESGPLKLFAVFEQDVAEQELAEILLQHTSSATMYTFDSLVDAVLPLARYKHAIAEEFTARTLPNADFAVSDIIVDTRVRRVQSGRDENSCDSAEVIKFADHVTTWLNTTGSQHVALLGDYGQGKSTAALELTYKLLHDAKFSGSLGKRIPLLIRLTGLSPKTTTPEDLLGAWGTNMGLNGRALLALHRAGKTVLIFDAFDEMANVSDRADRLDHFGALWRYACEDSKIIFTGRPNFFLDNEELKRVLGISEDVPVGPHCAAIRIEPFSLDEIRGSLRWLPKDKSDALVSIIEAHPRLNDIASRPSLLFQLSQLWDRNRIELENGDMESGAIIKSFVTYSIERQVRKQHADLADSGDRGFIQLRESELTFFTAGCAAAALSEGRNNTLPEPVFRRTIADMWERMGLEEGFTRKPSEQGALTLRLKERLADEFDPVEVCQQVVRTHGVIELDPTRRAVYKFSHESFAEAICAAVIACGALDSEDDLTNTRKVVRPLELTGQFTVFQFCYDFARSFQSEGVTLAEHRVYCNILRLPDNLMTRMSYYGSRVALVSTLAFFLRRAKVLGSLEALGIVNDSLMDMCIRTLRDSVFSIRRLVTVGLGASVLVMGFGLAVRDQGTLVGDIWWLSGVVMGVSLLTSVMYLMMLSSLTKRSKIFILISYMFANAKVSVEHGKKKGGQHLGRTLEMVLRHPSLFTAYQRELW